MVVKKRDQLDRDHKPSNNKSAEYSRGSSSGAMNWPHLGRLLLAFVAGLSLSLSWEYIEPRTISGIHKITAELQGVNETLYSNVQMFSLLPYTEEEQVLRTLAVCSCLPRSHTCNEMIAIIVCEVATPVHLCV